MFDFAFQKFYEKNLTILKFFYLIQIIFFYVFVIYFKKKLALCLVATPSPRNFNF